MAQSEAAAEEGSRRGNHHAAASAGAGGPTGAIVRAHSSRHMERHATSPPGEAGPSLSRAAGPPPPPPAATTNPALSPRFLSAESRLAQEKAWLADALPQHCQAEPIRGSDFVWSFKVAGLHRTLYQVSLSRRRVSGGSGRGERARERGTMAIQSTDRRFPFCG